MAFTSIAFTGNFDNPVRQSQSAFRTVMDCMARPGTIGSFGALANPPRPLGLAQGIIALTLCDQDTPVWLSAELASSPAAPWLSFHAGALVTGDRATARFAFSDRAAPFPAFSAFAKGTQDYPDRSTTIVVEIDALEGGETFVMTGPGIETETIIAPKGLPKAFSLEWAENRSLFPRGIDLVLTAGNRFLCMPRSVRLAPGRINPSDLLSGGTN